MRSTILALCALAILVVVVIFFCGENNSSAPGESTQATRSSEAAPSRSSMVASRTATDEKARGQNIQTSRFVESDQPTFVKHGRRVRVIDGETGERVPGAVVTYVDPQGLSTSDMMASLAERGYAGYLEGVLDRFGLLLTCDQRGETRVPRGGKGALVSANTKSQFGISFFRWTSSDVVTLKLHKVGVGQIQTVGPDGSPMAGVPVAVENVGSGGSVSLVHWRGVTQGPEAMVRLRDLDAVQRQLGRSGADHQSQLRVTLGFPVRSPPGVILKDDRFPAEPIRLQVPPTGRVVVNVTKPRDRPLRLQLHVDDPGNPYARAGLLQTSSENGRAVFERVGLGLPLKLLVQDPLELLASKEVCLQSPVEPGKEVEIDVALGTPRAALVGRIVGAGGEPVALGQLQVLTMPVGNRDRMWKSETTAWKTSTFTTDADGHFRIVLEEKEARATASGPLIVALAVDPAATKPNPLLEGQVEIAGPFPPGDTDIGDISIAELPIALAGRVMDERNRPLADVKVSMHPGRPGDRSIVVRDVSRGHSTVTNAEGRFVLRSPAASGEWTVRYERDGYLPPEHERRRSLSYDHFVGTRGSVSARIGEKDRVLVLTRTGAITGSLLVDPDVNPPQNASVFIDSGRPVLPTNRGSRPDQRRTAPDAGGNFEFRGLRPGRYDLLIKKYQKRGGLKVLCTVQDLVVKSGNTNQDPRLQRVDLRGQLPPRKPLRHFVLTVRDERGRPLPSVSVLHYALTGTEYGLTGADGSMTLQDPRLSQSTRLTKAGFQTVSVKLKPGENDVILQRVYVIHVNVSCAVKVPGDNPFWVNISRDPGRDSFRNTRLTNRPWNLGRLREERDRMRSPPPAGLGGLVLDGFEGAGNTHNSWWATVSYPDPGRYRIKLGTSTREKLPPDSRGRRRSSSRSIQIGTTRFIDVRPGEFENLVRIELTEKELGKKPHGAK